MSLAVRFDNVSKRYRLGEIGTRSLARDMKQWCAKLRGRSRTLHGTCNDQDSGGEYVWALRDVNLGIEQGEVFGIIGPNGAGKSTLLKLLSSVTAPTEGRIQARGRIASLLEVGTGFHPELTGRENVFLNGAILGMTRQQIRRRLDEIVDFSGCAKYIDTPVKRYSSGMTVRLGFAVAAHLECEVLVVDEVLAVGDASFQRKCIGRMSEVAGRGNTVLFVSHSMQSVEQLCTQACVLERGRIAMIGPVSDAITEYFRSISAGSRMQVADDGETRPGTGAARISRIHVHNQQGQPVTSFEKGEKVRLAFVVRVNEAIEQLGIVIVIASGMTRQAATSIERVVMQEPMRTGSVVEFSIDFDTSLMRPGVYPLEYSLTGPAGGQVYDVVQNGTRPLSIVGDGTGRIKGVFDVRSRILERKSTALKHDPSA